MKGFWKDIVILTANTGHIQGKNWENKMKIRTRFCFLSALGFSMRLEIYKYFKQCLKALEF